MSQTTPHDTAYDAILIVAFGGPEGQDDVLPFLENVLRGRNIPRARMEEVATHYRQFGGVSPINDQIRALLAALQVELAAHGPQLPVYWGNRNWHPFLVDTLRQMHEEGVKRALAFFTSPYSSYSSCRQYLEDITRAQAEIGPSAPVVHRLRAYYNHPGFIEPNITHLRAAFDQLPPARRAAARLVFTAHSLPTSMAASSEYVMQLEETARLVAAGTGHSDWDLVYQSRSGPPHQPWLEPDINDHLATLATAGVHDVVILPIGFISDHLEVVYDLDTEARQTANNLGMTLVRAATVGTHPAFIEMIRALVMERLMDNPTRRFLGTHGPRQDCCPADCCPAPTRSGRPATDPPPHPPR